MVCGYNAMFFCHFFKETTSVLLVCFLVQHSPSELGLPKKKRKNMASVGTNSFLNPTALRKAIGLKW